MYCLFVLFAGLDDASGGFGPLGSVFPFQLICLLWGRGLSYCRLPFLLALLLLLEDLHELLVMLLSQFVDLLFGLHRGDLLGLEQLDFG